MNRAEQIVRSTLAPVAEGLRSRAVMFAAELIGSAGSWLVQLDARLPTTVRAPVQRFRSHVWQRVKARFPALADLRAHVDAAGPAARAGMTAQSLLGEPDAEPQAQDAPADMPALLRALREPGAEVAASAAAALADWVDPQFETECLAALREVVVNADGYFNPLTRIAALEALVRRLSTPPTPSELEPLLSVVRDVDAEVSMAAIDAVARHAPPHVALDQIMPVLLDDTGFFLPLVRDVATRALERAGLLTTSTS